MAPVARRSLRLLTAALLSGVAVWGLVTVINGVRLGSRQPEAAIYWSATALIGVLAAAAASLAVRLFRQHPGHTA